MKAATHLLRMRVEGGTPHAPSDHEEDNAPPDIKAERLRSLRLFRKYTIAYCE